MSKLSPLERTIIFAFIGFGLAVRLAHLTGPLDMPDWRQSTTAYMAYRMAQESPPDILHPKVVYRGSRDVRISEFPFYSFVVALVYKMMGTAESLPAARLVTLAFFLGSAFFLFRIVKLLLGHRTAWYVMAVYFCLPLALFYSRAVHYDIALIFFSHAFLFFALQFYCTGRWRYFVWSTTSATMAFLMKAP
ncbi:MAG: glycosyltransferase family 39 protein, partial [Lentisphaerota bacterium]